MAFFSDRTIVKRARWDQMKARQGAWLDLQLIKRLPRDVRDPVIENLDVSRSQLRQDLLALVVSDFRRDGFFVEYGATDGVDLNNTWLLEKHFGWTGILAEPARGWHGSLKANRACMIETRCIWKASGETLRFTEAPRGENSGISSFVNTSRKIRGTSYDVTTISLNDMLADNGAPARIDYMSVDTEGSEFDILNAVDFSRWSFGLMTIEHNHAPQRESIYHLLTGHGYMRILEDLSEFDDWYVPADTAARFARPNQK